MGTTVDNHSLFVDLDGTLLNSDLLLESALQLLKQNPLYLLCLPLWLLKGRANLKHQVARRVQLRTELLPFNQPFLHYLREQSAAGRQLILISASDQKLVAAVAEQLPIFSRALGSDGTVNLKAGAKLKQIQQIAGDAAFDYAGNEAADLPIWREARQAIVVNGSPRVKKLAASQSNVARYFDSRSAATGQLARALRLHQWLKNGLLFLPLILAHQLNEPELLFRTALGFLCFSLCASSVYLLNDMLDLEADRSHDSKSRRPFAAGQLPLGLGMLLSPLLLLVAFALSLLLPTSFTQVMAIYYLLTLMYSLFLKAQAVMDVLTLACLYTLRLIAGAAAIAVVPTFWLLAFSLFLFLSLALVKRYTELSGLPGESVQPLAGRAYVASDLGWLSTLGSVSGILAVGVFALYINAEATSRLYQTPVILWLICPLLVFLIGRIWLLARRGRLHEDPVVFAITDHLSQGLVLVSGLLIWLATRSVF